MGATVDPRAGLGYIWRAEGGRGKRGARTETGENAGHGDRHAMAAAGLW